MPHRFSTNVRPLVIASLAVWSPCLIAAARGQPEQPPTVPAAAPELTVSPDRPSFSDGCGFTPVGHLSLETGYTFTFRNRDGVETQRHNGPELLARFGLIDDRLELRVTSAGYVWSRSDSGSGGFDSTAGWSDLALGAKVKLLDQDGAVPKLCFEGLTTVGGGSDAISSQIAEPTLKLIASYDTGDLLWRALYRGHARR